MATTAKKFVGVAIFDFSDDGLTALKWAHDYLKLPKECKLGIILIKRVENQTPREKTDQPLDSWDIIEGSILSAEREDRAEKFQEYAGSFQKNIFAKIYEGEHIQETLQYAIDKLPDLDTLILGCAGADGQGSQSIPQINLQLSGCSMVLAKIDPGAKRALSLSAPAAPSQPPTQLTEGTGSDSTANNPRPENTAGAN